MKKICKQCEKGIKGKPKIWDDYYFCRDSSCLAIYLGLGPIEIEDQPIFRGHDMTEWRN